MGVCQKISSVLFVWFVWCVATFSVKEKCAEIEKSLEKRLKLESAEKKSCLNKLSTCKRMQTEASRANSIELEDKEKTLRTCTQEASRAIKELEDTKKTLRASTQEATEAASKAMIEISESHFAELEGLEKKLSTCSREVSEIKIEAMKHEELEELKIDLRSCNYDASSAKAEATRLHAEEIEKLGKASEDAALARYFKESVALVCLALVVADYVLRGSGLPLQGVKTAEVSHAITYAFLRIEESTDFHTLLHNNYSRILLSEFSHSLTDIHLTMAAEMQMLLAEASINEEKFCYSSESSIQFVPGDSVSPVAQLEEVDVFCSGGPIARSMAPSPVQDSRSPSSLPSRSSTPLVSVDTSVASFHLRDKYENTRDAIETYGEDFFLPVEDNAAHLESESFLCSQNRVEKSLRRLPNLIPHRELGINTSVMDDLNRAIQQSAMGLSTLADVTDVIEEDTEIKQDSNERLQTVADLDSASMRQLHLLDLHDGRDRSPSPRFLGQSNKTPSGSPVSNLSSTSEFLGGGMFSSTRNVPLAQPIASENYPSQSLKSEDPIHEFVPEDYTNNDQPFTSRHDFLNNNDEFIYQNDDGFQTGYPTSDTENRIMQEEEEEEEEEEMNPTNVTSTSSDMFNNMTASVRSSDGCKSPFQCSNRNQISDVCFPQVVDPKLPSEMVLTEDMISITEAAYAAALLPIVKHSLRTADDDTAETETSSDTESSCSDLGGSWVDVPESGSIMNK